MSRRSQISLEVCDACAAAHTRRPAGARPSDSVPASGALGGRRARGLYRGSRAGRHVAARGQPCHRAIEGELETALFVRRKDGVALTEAGRLATARARETLRHFDLLQAEVAAAAGRLTGTLRLASLPSATGTLIAVQVSAFTNRHPHVRVRLFEGTDQEVRDWLRQGAAELGVVTLPAPGFETVPLGTDEMVAVLPSEHELSAQATVSFDALGNERFILATGGCGPLIMAAARKAGARLHVAFEAREPAAILAMVAEGLGVSIMPTLGLPRDTGSVVMRPLEPRTPRTLALALGTQPDASPAARAFLDQVASVR